ncbi:unnamed protein product [Caenorhabditis auriculariae]|uniref:MH2 domain-containing protein n=1 Tax=Caenorhabditis auriculariae TaxID=2777116 RepID=A0A8S1H1G3_9PELO|nr:unnamed protein product [Caenorhabditis auriculariae]
MLRWRDHFTKELLGEVREKASEGEPWATAETGWSADRRATDESKQPAGGAHADALHSRPLACAILSWSVAWPSNDMQRAYDPAMTIREPNSRNCEPRPSESKRKSDVSVSRSSLVHGTQTSPNSDTWYDTDAFLLDQVKEVLDKLSEGSIDDEIWGKIVVMERCKRVAKAYLRKTTVIIDGSEDEFDGKTLGFNHFDNSTRDEHIQEIRSKIADGVILKMDFQGNIKGMARGATPVVCQGWKDTRSNCISDRLVRLQGKLNHGVSEDEKAYKMFDMRKFKNALERELQEEAPDARTLLLKTCVRVALVKDGPDMNRTPCWFAVVNLVALDMVKEKIPKIKSILSREATCGSKTAPAEGLDTQTLTQIIAAAVTQASKGYSMSQSLQNLAISPEQLAQIATTLNTASQNRNTSELTTINKKDKKKTYHCSTSSMDSSGEDSANVRSESGVKGRAKRWEQPAKPSSGVSESAIENEKTNDFNKKTTRAPYRPRLQDVIFTRCQSTTSDYDSNKEQFDSGSWSSTQSRYQERRSTSSSVVSDQELAALVRDDVRSSNRSQDTNIYERTAEIVAPTPRINSRIHTNPLTNEHLPARRTNSREDRLEESEEKRPTSVWVPDTMVREKSCSPPPPLPLSLEPAVEPAGHVYTALNGNIIERRSDTNAVYQRNSEEMEKRYGRNLSRTESRAASRTPFDHELRQVLEQRANFQRVGRNHSQPVGAFPNLRHFASERAVDRQSDRAASTTPSLQPRGLRRVHNLSQLPAVRVPPNLVQSTLCREQPLVRVTRTGSLPWGQWQHMRRTHM